ncbi:GyrI-like domain-containing protein [Zobellia uliginosa]|uniref:GyrI-like domain-containing protein n=1 Tax=Zobellia uliginosa TaxID=143224 RepID=UPI001C07BA2E|nr:GyrI-like domain-containing protein [Zobellia uliginosa]MBU2947468.1 GyrI-like domain-containing protein [Zobellia uliginosa]
MEPRIVQLAGKKLVGHSLKMSLANNRTSELWGGFMPLKRHIPNAVGTDLYSVQVYRNMPDSGFGPHTEFEKWATIEVSSYAEYALDFQTIDLKAGLYAVFIHRGRSSDFKRTMDFIFGKWIPASEYKLDHRPQFEVLGAKYKNDDPDSEEEVWIPISLK